MKLRSIGPEHIAPSLSGAPVRSVTKGRCRRVAEANGKHSNACYAAKAKLFLASLAGQYFLLNDVPRLSFMSLISHAIYGYLAAHVFEALEAREACLCNWPALLQLGAYRPKRCRTGDISWTALG